MATMTGTVSTRDRVERSSADADSPSIALYFAASRTTIVASGKLQQTSASRADGLEQDKEGDRLNRDPTERVQQYRFRQMEGVRGKC